MITADTTIGQFQAELEKRGLRCTMLAQMTPLWWCTVRDRKGIAYEGISTTMDGACSDALARAGEAQQEARTA